MQLIALKTSLWDPLQMISLKLLLTLLFIAKNKRLYKSNSHTTPPIYFRTTMQMYIFYQHSAQASCPCTVAPDKRVYNIFLAALPNRALRLPLVAHHHHTQQTTTNTRN